MDCKTFEELLSDFLEEDLNPDQQPAFENHLKSCQECKQLLVFMQRINSSLSSFPELEVSENLLSRLNAIPKSKKKFKLSFDFLIRPALQPILAAATVFLTLISLYAFHPNRSGINKSIDRQIHLGFSKVEKLWADAGSITNSLVGYKDDLLVSLNNINPLRKTEE